MSMPNIKIMMVMLSSYYVTIKLHAQFALINICFTQSPIPLGSTVLLESSLDKMEGRKIFISCKVTSTDGTKMYTDTAGNQHFYTCLMMTFCSCEELQLVTFLLFTHLNLHCPVVFMHVVQHSSWQSTLATYSKGIWHKCTSLPPTQKQWPQLVWVCQWKYIVWFFFVGYCF